ncbi:hypothetical protein I4F81_007279 [Pyropia yezoensis]|uniref:Uncharacterized protein n=1 Tax=Pyropia yezoensis TaxID=2788 RepID=A0ACC3C3G4_PYRYE|nr:hypothetical protein I4F81_007279 [Neopyropia yezoensis]
MLRAPPERQSHPALPSILTRTYAAASPQAAAGERAAKCRNRAVTVTLHAATQHSRTAHIGTVTTNSRRFCADPPYGCNEATAPTCAAARHRHTKKRGGMHVPSGSRRPPPDPTPSTTGRGGQVGGGG